jgi:type IV pilus assembly protein PilX
MRNTNQYRFRSQRGAVLIVALVLLLVLTVLGTAGIRDTTMEERMAGNFRDYAAALEAAETALRRGEGGVSSTSVFTGMLFDGSDGTYEVTAVSQSVDPQTASNYGLSVAASLLTDDGGKLLVSAVPEYYIEQLPEIELPASDLTVGFQDQAPRVQYYRVTSKGYGVSPNTEVILQSTYFR